MDRLNYIFESKPAKNDQDVFTEGIFTLIEYEDVNYCEHEFKKEEEYLSDLEVLQLLNEQHETIQALHCEINKKQSILETKIKNLQIDLDKLTYVDTSDLNPQAVADVRTVIEISLSALKQLEKELKGD